MGFLERLFRNDPPADLLERPLTRAPFREEVHSLNWSDEIVPSQAESAAFLAVISGERGEVTDIVTSTGPDPVPWWPILMSTRNPEPNCSYTELESFLGNPNEKEFRAVAVLDNVQVRVDDEGQPIGFRYECQYRLGYTPWSLRSGFRAMFQRSVSDRDLLRKRHYSLGDGHAQFDCEQNNGSIVASCQVAYKVSKLFKWLGYPVMRLWPPFAATKISYEFRSDSTFCIVFEGTRIPTQYLYTGRADCYFTYNMAEAPDKELGEPLDGFFVRRYRDQCRVADLYYYKRWPNDTGFGSLQAPGTVTEVTDE